MSARNALKHGLRGRDPVAGPEQQAMAAHTAQLTAHYGPQSPLEHLQIQRIARCAAKLETLYAIEQARTALALMQSEATDESSMMQFAHYPAQARHLARQMLNQTVVAPPFGLTDRLLGQLCLEINDFAGVLTSESDLGAIFPRMGKFLKSAVIEGSDKSHSASDRLWLMARWLATRMNAYPDDPKPRPLTGEERVDQLLVKLNNDLLYKECADRGVRPLGGGGTFHSLIQADFSVFRQLLACRQQAAEIVARFQRVKDLVATSTMMPGEDSDRLMRYQTTLEKQLSRYVGELLQLRSLVTVR